MPREFGGFLAWGSSISAGSQLMFPKQPVNTRLVSVSFDWTWNIPESVKAAVFSVVYYDGAGNIVAMIAHDICDLPLALSTATVTALNGATTLLMPEIQLTSGTLTFGLSLQSLNIAKNPQLGSDRLTPGGILSQHPIPWKVATKDGEQCGLEFTSREGGTSSVRIPRVVYRFANF